MVDISIANGIINKLITWGAPPCKNHGLVGGFHTIGTISRGVNHFRGMGLEGNNSPPFRHPPEVCGLQLSSALLRLAQLIHEGFSAWSSRCSSTAMVWKWSAMVYPTLDPLPNCYLNGISMVPVWIWSTQVCWYIPLYPRGCNPVTHHLQYFSYHPRKAMVFESPPDLLAYHCWYFFTVP